MTNKEVTNIFLNVSIGVGGHGSFLRNLAMTALSADKDNLNAMMPLLKYIIVKYKLTGPEYTTVK